ncbi:MAG: hypothetical protein WB818_18590, partial [Desulfobacterales bacterium]
MANPLLEGGPFGDEFSKEHATREAGGMMIQIYKYIGQIGEKTGGTVRPIGEITVQAARLPAAAAPVRIGHINAECLDFAVQRADIDTQVSGSQLPIPVASLQDFGNQQ